VVPLNDLVLYKQNQLNFACGGHGGIIGPISVWWLEIFGGPLVDSILSHSVGFLYNKSD